MAVVQSGRVNVDNKFSVTADELREEVRPVVTRFIKQIALYADNKYNDGGRMTAAIAIGIYERVILNVAKKIHPLGSEEGRKFIEAVYDAAKKDTLKLWGSGPSEG